MAETIPYMGTKRELSAAVLRATASCRQGSVVDLFAGMGSVAAAHDRSRPVWANDIQNFAYLNNKCRLTGPDPKLLSIISADDENHFKANYSALLSQAKEAARASADLGMAADYASFLVALRKTDTAAGHFGNAYCCFVNRYAATYFSLAQCAEIDSIRYMLEMMRGRGRINQDEFDWGVVCLGAAALRCANTTGHFAQYLRPNEGNWRRVQRQFRKAIWTSWMESLARLKPFGDPSWRKMNRVSRLDANEALKTRSSDDIGVVYCDPPYTDDQYSRFYHLWETVVLYDYPPVFGRGRYRPDRFVTDFSSVRKVSSAFVDLIKEVADAGADFVLSYPSNGLLHQAGGNPLDLMSGHFRESYLAQEITHEHSSMGASKGAHKSVVSERIYVGRHGY